MATVTGFTAERMAEIEANSVVSGEVDVDGDLILIRQDSSEFNAGNVKGADGDPGPTGAPGTIPPHLQINPGSTYTPDASLYSDFTFLLDGDLTLSPPTSGQPGQRITYEFVQLGGGNYDVVFSGLGWSPVIPDFTVSQEAGSISFMGIRYSSYVSTWHVMAVGEEY
jgi:hypothetical protein